MSSITLQGLHKTYEGGQGVIQNVNLHIADGEFCVFVGPSGCGKSTLLRMIAGLESITQGQLFIGDQCVNDFAPSQRNVAMVFQNYALYPHMDVATNIGFGLRLAGIKKAEIDSKVAGVAQLLEIQSLLGRKPGVLSGGQRQRVAIARALVRDPGVFLFDEPLSNLDAALRTQTRVEIAKMHRDHGRASTVYVTHDQVEAMTLADKIVLLHTDASTRLYGSVAQAGPPMELYSNPANLFVAGFIGSPKMNFLPATVAQIRTDGILLSDSAGAQWLAAVNAKGVQLGDAVTAGVRSEHVQLHSQAKIHTLPSIVHWVERLGDMTLLHLRCANQQLLIARQPGDSTAQVGDVVHIQIPAQNCHVFDREGIALPRLPAA